MLGNTQGTVAAVATAAIAGSIAPGSFYGMNWKGDCLTGEGSTSKAPFNCGVDINLTSSSGSTACTKMDGTSSGVVAKLCAPAGIFLSSECDGSSQAGCGSGNSNNAGSNYAGQTGNNPDVWAESGTHIKGNGWVGRPANWLPANTLSNHSTTNTGDPTRPLPQPPVLNPSQPTCAVKDGDIKNNQTLGPFQYYHVNSNNVATGLPIAIGNNMSVTFSPSSTFCPGASSGTPSTGTFKTFTFWGGMDINGNANTTVNFGAGQYVMAGTNSTTGTVFSMGAGGNTNGGSVTGESGAKGGTQFLFTDGTYSSQGTSLAPPPALTSAGVNLYQGFTDIKNIDINLNGLTGNAPTLLTDYKGIMFWQDRRNSTVHLNPNNGDFIDRVRPATTTDTSPQMVFEDGNANVNLKGVMYQGRGAWLYLKAGGAGVGANVTLETITGALNCGNGCGSATFTLKGPGAPLTVYVTSLIQ